jgi:hypothetical protein
MIATRRQPRRGSVMVEFALAGVASLTMMISMVQLCIGLWHYHTLAYAVHECTRYVTVHGRGCLTGTTTCSITVGDIATRLSTDAIGLFPDDVNVTLTTDSGATTTCNPLSSCLANGTRWPPTSLLDNTTGKHVTVSANYLFRHSMFLLWPGAAAQQFGAFFFPAQSTQTILF